MMRYLWETMQSLNWPVIAGCIVLFCITVWCMYVAIKAIAEID